MRGMALTVSRPRTVEEFLAQAGDFLARHEAEHNLLLGIASTIRQSPEIYGEPPRFAVVSDEQGTVKAATLQTPPFNVVLSMSEDEAATDALADALRGDPLPGVLGPKDVAARFAARWAGAGRTAALDVAERIFRLDRLIPPMRPARGRWRIAEERDRTTIARWLVAFREEADPESPPMQDPDDTAGRWIAQVGRIVYLWDDDDEVVSMVGAGGETPNGIRIGPVYTPPERRGNGYASSLTAAASQDQLDRGRRFVFLFTDLANPTSNKIYQAIGYEPVIDIDMYRFADA
ncbi:GNAT family N-acetyltransferase [soil metagenome]